MGDIDCWGAIAAITQLTRHSFLFAFRRYYRDLSILILATSKLLT